MVFDLKVEATIRRRDLILGLAGRVAPPGGGRGEQRFRATRGACPRPAMPYS